MTKTPLPVIRLDHYPSKGEKISGYGVVTDVQNMGAHTCHSFVRIGDKTMLVDYTSALYTVYHSPDSKNVYFTKLKEVPEVGNCYKMERYTTLFGISHWELENVTCGKIIGVKTLWDNFYYAESRNSAYFIIVE